MSTRVLVVDDEPQLADLIARHLRREGYAAEIATDGIAALSLTAAQDFDLAIVDVNMPGMTGFELSRRLKQGADRIGVLLLTARDSVEDRVHGLDSGADDYLIKPFDFAELFARLRALSRREGLGLLRVAAGDLVLIMDRGVVEVNGEETTLSRREFDLLRVLAQRQGETVERGEILDAVWGSEHFQSNIVDQYVRYLRRKLSDAGSDVQISTERGVGFRLITGPSRRGV